MTAPCLRDVAIADAAFESTALLASSGRRERKPFCRSRRRRVVFLGSRGVVMMVCVLGSLEILGRVMR